MRLHPEGNGLLSNWQKILRPLSVSWQVANNVWTGKAPAGAIRSSRWPAVREAHLAEHPRCACCGGTKKLRVHHLVPFHVDPELELDPTNLLTLCEAKKYGINCHLLIGHLGHWKRWNSFAVIDARLWTMKLCGDFSSAAEKIGDWLKKKIWARGVS